MKSKNYYQTLGVPRDATQEVIKNAYRKLARKYHPDVSRELHAELRFKEVGEAYKVLKDPEKRLEYDQMSGFFHTRKESPQPQASRSYGFDSQKEARTGTRSAKRSDDNFSDILDEMMGRPNPAPPRHRSINVHGSDQHAKVQIDLEDTFHGTACNISMPTYVTDEYGMPMVSKRTLKVSVPKGIRGGQTLRLAGQGFPGMGEGKAGDLYLEVMIRPHRRYRVEGRDIYFDIPLTSAQAAVGTTVNVPTPEGSVQLSIPAGSMPGRRLRLKGKGIPGDPAGDLYAVIVNVPTSVHTMVAQKAYQALKAAFSFAPH
ncbi:Curved DNA-binding protein [Herminiimonas arsenicoxydans]|uniref:Curved DNA-binding protein n=1 Tax=Herminiimonas arsenicoxydans TaxID=204773 RepID=A4G5R4_HERAR|nr:Curved DNA-binding protein [Herminiimonas arsenicoxydans]